MSRHQKQRSGRARERWVFKGRCAVGCCYVFRRFGEHGLERRFLPVSAFGHTTTPTTQGA